MPKDKHILSRGAWHRSWPEEFTQERPFLPNEENKTYFEFVRDVDRQLDELEEHEGEGEVEGDDNEYESINEDDERLDQHTFNRIDGYSKVGIFMTGLLGDIRELQQDHVQQVARFCDHATGDDKRPVALLDDRSNNPSSNYQKSGTSRPYLGPLTVPQLVAELSKPRFSTSTNVFDDDKVVDAERRLIFINALDACSIEALATTATLRQAPALTSLFCKHVTGKSSISVDIPSQGYRHFTLEFCIPYFVRRSHKKLLKDPRLDPDGHPLRQSWESPSSPRSMGITASTDTVECVYEAHIAFAVTGNNHRVWTAYCFVDTYFSAEDSVTQYHDTYGGGGWADPLSAGHIDANFSISDPRYYFFKIVEHRIRLILSKYSLVVDNLEKEIKQSRVNHSCATDLKTRQEKRNQTREWMSQKMKELRFFKDALSESVAAWKKFKETDLENFEDIEDIVGPSFQIINKAFSNLNDLRRKVLGMIEELCQDYPQGLHAQLSFENNEAAVFQQKSASHIQVLTYITILFIPVAVASSLFSMQGVLPFASNLTHFAWVLILLIILVAVTLIVLTNLEKCLKPISDFFHTDILNQFLHLFHRIISSSSRVCAVILSLASKCKQRGMELAFVTGRVLHRVVFFRQHRRERDLERGREIEFDNL